MVSASIVMDVASDRADVKRRSVLQRGRADYERAENDGGEGEHSVNACTNNAKNTRKMDGGNDEGSAAGSTVT